MRILIVDDAAAERAILAHIVRDLGHDVAAEASDVPSALEAAKERGLDLAAVDGRLPSGGCLAAVRALRGAHPGIVLIVIAALGEIDLVREAVTNGAAGAFRRPLLRSQVEAALHALTRP